jgi:hypothetical protein
MENKEINTRLVQLAQSSNYYNLNPIIPIPDCSEEINMIVQLLENGYYKNLYYSQFLVAN